MIRFSFAWLRDGRSDPGTLRSSSDLSSPVPLLPLAGIWAAFILLLICCISSLFSGSLFTAVAVAVVVVVFLFPTNTGNVRYMLMMPVTF